MGSLFEDVKHGLERLLVHADACICHFELVEGRSLCSVDLCKLELDLASVGELGGVADEVEEDLFELCVVSGDLTAGL